MSKEIRLRLSYSLRNSTMSNKKAFTLIELTVTIVIIVIIAMSAFINYTRAFKQSYERDVLLRLRIMQNVMEVTKRKTSDYPTSNMTTLAELNTALGLQTPANTYYNSYAYTYTAPAVTPGVGTYTLAIGTTAGWAITYDSSTSKYYCSAGTCPTCTASTCP